MTTAELQAYLCARIPQAESMQINITAMNEQELTLTAPLAPNINHRDSVFGGSASSIAILSAWAYLHQRLATEGVSTTLVIQRNTMEYDDPIIGEFAARAFLIESSSWSKFSKMLSRKGKARISVNSELLFDDKVAGRFQGDFVAVGYEKQ